MHNPIDWIFQKKAKGVTFLVPETGERVMAALALTWGIFLAIENSGDIAALNLKPYNYLFSLMSQSAWASFFVTGGGSHVIGLFLQKRLFDYYDPKENKFNRWHVLLSFWLRCLGLVIEFFLWVSIAMAISTIVIVNGLTYFFMAFYVGFVFIKIWLA